MTTLSDERFDELISRAMDELPQEYITGLDNVVILMADDPTPEQADQAEVGRGHLLLGLYEGTPLTRRSSAVGSLPDRITLFKNQITQLVGEDEARLFDQIKRTLWHEIAHYYGLEHADMERLQGGRD